MKVLRSRFSLAAVASLILLTLSVVASMAGIVFAAPKAKSPTVFVTGSGYLEMTWKSGKSETYSADSYANLGGLETIVITPTHGWHIDTILFDGSPQNISDEDGFTVTDVQAKDTISVTFVENGGVDDVETGLNVTTYPDPDVGLIFDDVLVTGFAYAYIIELQQPDQIGDSWDIQTDAAFDRNITLYLVINLADLPNGTDPYNLTLWRTEVVLGDVNLDGIVDGKDQSLIANANPNEYIPSYDLNTDGKVDDDDVEICAHNQGLESVWEQLESWVVVENDRIYVYGITEHLSIFGVHYGEFWD
ncbi:MAG: hypothetical protein JSV51_06140 [Candidatus Bathyarchaeota archaeon]|nr:MAG: hypothetical protein JSV51_06140 [Candidatus Bathyarchaeota archaeon]